MRSKATLSAAILIAVAALQPAVAGELDNPFERGTSDRFAISLGGFFMNFNTTARVDSDRLPGSGTDVDLENDTALSNSKTDLRLDGYWRFANKHRLEFGAMKISRESSRVIDRQITWGDTVFDVGANLDSEFSTNLFKLSYKYSFIRSERNDFGFSAGFSIYGVGARMAGAGSVDGGPSGQFSRETNHVVAPVPVLGLHEEFRLSKKWFFKSSGEYFHINVGDITGSLGDLRASFDWYPFKHFGFGGGFNRVRLKYTDVSSTSVDFEYKYSGATVYGTYIF
jgi:hypothetical protein